MNSQSFLTKKCGLPVKQALMINPDLAAYMRQNKLDLGNTKALLMYNQLILKHFMDLEFDLPDGYLVPTICSRWAFLKHILKLKPKNVLEIGTGASAILALMLGRLGISVSATEIDNTAFQSACSNVRRNNLEKSIILVKSNRQLLVNLIPQVSEFDLILCNPPQYDEVYFEQHRNSNRGFLGNYSEMVGGQIGHEFILSLLSELRTFSNPPPVYFQLTLPKLQPKLEGELKNQKYNFSVTSKQIGTRLRLYYNVEITENQAIG
ncbi:MAG: RlmF-related methyltransferase [Candidatus Hodarchaeales archaeon]|jgi:methylase of polypeptide subunit release factors